MIIKIIIQNSKKPKKKVKAKIKERNTKIEGIELLELISGLKCLPEDDIILYCLEKGYGLPPIGDKKKRDIWFIKHGILPPLDEGEKYD